MGTVVTEPISRTKSFCQGNPDAPKYFNIVYDADVEWFHEICQQKKWGYPLEQNFYLGILTFADNFWLIAMSAKELQSMMQCWFERTRGSGWTIPLAECKWCTTASDSSRAHVRVNGMCINRASRDEGFLALGSLVSFDNRFDNELNQRIRKAWAVFNLHRSQLCCKDASLRKRILLLVTLVVPTLFWCSGSWNLTKEQESRLRGVQRSMVVRCCASSGKVVNRWTNSWHSAILPSTMLS